MSAPAHYSVASALLCSAAGNVLPQIVPMIACSDVAELVVALKQWALRKLGKDGEAGSTPAGAGLPHACKVDRARLGSPTV